MFFALLAPVLQAAIDCNGSEGGMDMFPDFPYDDNRDALERGVSTGADQIKAFCAKLVEIGLAYTTSADWESALGREKVSACLVYILLAARN